MNKLLVKIPFQGFYESDISFAIDNEIECFLENEGLEFEQISYDIDWKAIARKYIDFYQNVLNDELGVKVLLNFESLISPKFYNFETDIIFAELSLVDAKAIKEAFIKCFGLEHTQSKAKAIYQSRGGFVSFYNGYAKNWQDKDINNLDSNELALFFVSDYDKSDYDNNFIDWITCSGDLSNAVNITIKNSEAV